jgi:hypothetical protein
MQDAAQALALVVSSCPDATREPEALATLLQTSGAVRARLQHTSGHTHVTLGSLMQPDGRKASKAAVKQHATRLAAFAGWLPPHAALVEHLSVECHDSRSAQPLVDAFKRCAAAASAAAAPAAQLAQPRAGRSTRRLAAAARKLPPAAPVPLQLRSLTVGHSLPSTDLLTPLAGNSSLTHLQLSLAREAPVPGLAAALAQLRNLRALALRNGLSPDAPPALAQLNSLGSLEWRGLAWPQLAPLLAQLPASVGTLLLDLDMMATADGNARTAFEWDDEPGPAKLEVDASDLHGLRSLDVTAVVWDDDGHSFWHGKLVPTLPPGLTRLVMHGRSEAVCGATSALQELSLTEWWMDPPDLTTLISTAAPSLLSLHLQEYGPDNLQRDYEVNEEVMTAAEGAALTAAIGSAMQLTRLVVEVASIEWLAPPGGGPNSTSAALEPGFAAALASLPSLQVLVTNVWLSAATTMRLTALTRLSVLHLDDSATKPATIVALCGALRGLCDLSLRIPSSATGSVALLLSAAAQLTSLTRLQMWGGGRLAMTAGDLQLLRPLRQLRWCTLPSPLRAVPQQAVRAFAASMPHLQRVASDEGHRYSMTEGELGMEVVSL